MIIIAHRLSTIAGAGNILVMEEGQVVEQGTHAQLLSHHGRYQALWQAQMAARVWRDDGVSASGEWVHGDVQSNVKPPTLATGRVILLLPASM